MSQVLKRITETTDCTDSTDENLKKSVEFNNPKSVQSAKSVVPNVFYRSEASPRYLWNMDFGIVILSNRNVN